MPFTKGYRCFTFNSNLFFGLTPEEVLFVYFNELTESPIKVPETLRHVLVAPFGLLEP
jgi:hypothetical protein